MIVTRGGCYTAASVPRAYEPNPKNAETQRRGELCFRQIKTDRRSAGATPPGRKKCCGSGDSFSWRHEIRELQKFDLAGFWALSLFALVNWVSSQNPPSKTFPRDRETIGLIGT